RDLRQTKSQGCVPRHFIAKSSPSWVRPSQIRRHSTPKAVTSIRATADIKPLYVCTNERTSLVSLAAPPFAGLRRERVRPISARVVSADDNADVGSTGFSRGVAVRNGCVNNNGHPPAEAGTPSAARTGGSPFHCFSPTVINSIE